MTTPTASSLSPLNRLYEAILSFCSIYVDRHGEAYWIHPDETLSEADRRMPFTVEDRVILLPTQRNLKNFNIDDKTMFFSPIPEQVNRGESEILTRYRHMLNVKLNMSIAKLMVHLMAVVASPKLHSRLTPEQRELLLEVTEMSETTMTNFVKFHSSVLASHGNRLFVNIFLKKNGKHDDKTRPCVGVVQFPLKDLLEDETLNKALKTKKDKAAVLSVLNFIFPGCNENAALYNDFSENREAPRLEALLKSATGLASRINAIADLFMNCSHLSNDDPELIKKEMESIKFDLSWEPLFANLKQMAGEIAMIPAQPGNAGALGEAEPSQPAPRVPVPEPERVKAPAVATPAPAQRTAPAPTAPVPVKTSLGLRQLEPAPANVPQPYHTTPVEVVRPRDEYHYPLPKQAQQDAPPPGGISLASLLNKNPELAARAGVVPNTNLNMQGPDLATFLASSGMMLDAAGRVVPIQGHGAGAGGYPMSVQMQLQQMARTLQPDPRFAAVHGQQALPIQHGNVGTGNAVVDRYGSIGVSHALAPMIPV